MNLETIASFATPLGVVIATWQLWLSRKLAQTTFEDSLDQHYRNIVMQIPVDVLLGKPIPAGKEKQNIREIIYNYLDLCNEQAYLKEKKRITEDRWKEWEEGIRDNIKKRAFKEVWDEIKQADQNHFSSLAKLECNNLSCDPAKY